jgi:hypothetical protein
MPMFIEDFDVNHVEVLMFEELIVLSGVLL